MQYNRYLVKFYANGKLAEQYVHATSEEKAENFIIEVYSRRNMAVDIITTIKIS